MFLMPFNCTVEKDEIKASELQLHAQSKENPIYANLLPPENSSQTARATRHLRREVGPTCQPQGGLFFFPLLASISPFPLGEQKQKNTQYKFTGNSLYRGKVNLRGEKRWRTKKPPRTEFGPELGGEEGGGGGKIGALRRQWSGRGLGGRGEERIGGFLERLGSARRGGENSTRFSSLLLFLSRLLFPA